MHMFFVAFNKRQKKIVEYVEEPIQAAMDRDEVLVVEGNVLEEKVPLTVVELEEEIDLDWWPLRLFNEFMILTY